MKIIKLLQNLLGSLSNPMENCLFLYLSFLFSYFLFLTFPGLENIGSFPFFFDFSGTYTVLFSELHAHVIFDKISIKIAS